MALVGPFIVDFVSRKAKLVIELDGGQHDRNRGRDARRTSQIEAAGYRVLRFWNNDVLGNIDGVLAEIQSALTAPGGYFTNRATSSTCGVWRN